MGIADTPKGQVPEAAPVQPAATPSGAAEPDLSTPGEWFVRYNADKTDCFVAAPDCKGYAYGAEILGDDEYTTTNAEYDRGDLDAGLKRKIADCELIVAAVKAYRASHGQTPAGATPAEAVERIVHLRAVRERRIYVAGPMTGLPEYNFPLFNSTAERLRSEGWHVENPAEHGHVEGAGWADYLRWDISRIATCGAIYLLPGWEKSKGARLEVHIAGVLGLRALLADGAEAPPADSVLEDAARLDWLLLRISGAEFRRIGVHYSGNARRADVDAARKQGGA